jgi:hypothetical protein
VITSEEQARARYKKIEHEVDGLGRKIGVRRLRPSEQTKLIGMTAELSGFEMTTVTEDDGKSADVAVPHRGPLLIAASVCQVGEFKLDFPRSRAELDSVYDTLDVWGLRAATIAMTRLNDADDAYDATDTVEAAKN